MSTSKEKRKEMAVLHTQKMDELYKNETENSVKNSVVHTCINKDINIRLEDCTTSDALLFYPEEKVCVLNFASYTTPGGGFINGSIAQEESLCHDSNLYNILKEFDEQYKGRDDKDGLYEDIAIWTPDVQFVNPVNKKVDVITCAAPNYGKYRERYEKDRNFIKNSESMDPDFYVSILDKLFNENYKKALEKRCEYILDVAAEHEEKILILGAFGCGVFGNEPEKVAWTFKELLTSGVYEFKEVMFAVPVSEYNDNYEKFSKVFND